MAQFSSLALTQALPFLPLAQGDIDYQVDRRNDPNLIAEALQQPATKVILVRHGQVAVPFGQANTVSFSAVKMRLATLPGSYVAEELKHVTGAVAMYLGRYDGARAEEVIAVDISGLHVAAPEEDLGCEDSNQTVHQSILATAGQRFDWVDLREFAPHASAREVGQATTAVCLGGWHERQRHCPACGAPTQAANAGWAQHCTNEADGFRELFPRIEPAVITAIVDSEDRLLLQHNRAWKNPALYSVSAGFVEAGENLEHACRREAKEETGITVGEVKYLGSQPWPYKASLMVAFKGRALSTEIHVDGEETVEACWVTRDEYQDALITGRMEAPGKATIARVMIEEWLGREI